MRCCTIFAFLTPLAAASLQTLDNGQIRVAVDLEMGGAIVWLSTASGPNMVNSWDQGRQIQQSYYAGPRPFGQAHPSWKNWPWNPIGSGDAYRHRSQVLDSTNDGKTLYVRTLPLQWALNNVPCECTFETWITLDGNVAHVRARLNNQRTDHAEYPALDQELPALYTNGPWYRLMTYDGDEPFRNAAVREVPRTGPPWAHWTATENWAALLNDAGTGVGLFHPGIYRFLGGFAGQPGKGGANDSPTGYIAPVEREIIDHDIRYEYQYSLIVGTLADIRGYVYQHAPDPRPDYRFDNSRAHWTLTGAADTGLPSKHWRIETTGNDPQAIGPPGLWNAKDVPKLYIRAAHHTKQDTAEIFWSIPGEGFSASRHIVFPINNDGAFHTYVIDMPWTGKVTGLRFDPVPAGAQGEFVDLEWISWNQSSAEIR